MFSTIALQQDFSSSLAPMLHGNVFIFEFTIDSPIKKGSIYARVNSCIDTEFDKIISKVSKLLKKVRNFG